MVLVVLSTSLLFDDMIGQNVADRKRRRETSSPLPARLEWPVAFVSSIWLDVIVKEDVSICGCVCV